MANLLPCFTQISSTWKNDSWEYSFLTRLKFQFAFDEIPWHNLWDGCVPRSSTYALPTSQSSCCSCTLPRDIPSSGPLLIQVAMEALVIHRNVRCCLHANFQQSTVIILSQISPVQQLKFSTAKINTALILLGYQVISEVYFKFFPEVPWPSSGHQNVASWLTSIFIM